jgi:hypothetical protein
MVAITTDDPYKVIPVLLTVVAPAATVRVPLREKVVIPVKVDDPVTLSAVAAPVPVASTPTPPAAEATPDTPLAVADEPWTPSADFEVPATPGNVSESPTTPAREVVPETACVTP